MTDQPVTPDREVIIEAVDEALTPSAVRCLVPDRCLFGAPDRIVDALLPLLTDALDRARQQGRADAFNAGYQMGFKAGNDFRLRLARGADRKDER